MKNNRVLRGLSVALSILLAINATAGENINGADSHRVKISIKPGSGTLQRAIRQAKTINGDVVIELEGGVYRTDRTIEITAGRWRSLHIRPKEGAKVSITGDKAIPLNRVNPVNDEAVRCRLQENVRDKVLEVDCSGMVRHLADIHPTGFGRKSLPAWSELIVNGEPLVLSRWPNDTMALIGKVEVSGGDEDKRQGRLPVFHYRDKRPSVWQGGGSGVDRRLFRARICR